MIWNPTRSNVPDKCVTDPEIYKVKGTPYCICVTSIHESQILLRFALQQAVF